MDRFDLINVLHDAEQIFLMEALRQQSEAETHGSKQLADSTLKHAQYWQQQAQRAGGFKRQLEKQR